MLIDDTILVAHRELSSCSVEFLYYISKNPELLNRSHYKMLAKHDQSTYEFPGTLQPWPTFINEKSKNKMASSALSVKKLIAHIPERVFLNDCEKMSEYYDLPIDAIELLMEEAGTEFLNSRLGRGDFILSCNNEFKCIEFNITPNVGGSEVDLMEEQYLKVPAIATFLLENKVRRYPSQLFMTLLQFILQLFNRDNIGNLKEVNLAIAVSTVARYAPISVRLKNLYREALNNFDTRFQGDLFISDVKDFVIDGNSLFANNKRIHILIQVDSSDCSHLWFSLAKQKRLQLYNGPTTQIMCNKLNLALLSEHQESELFTYEERRNIALHIPWTRKTVPGRTSYGTERVQLEEFALRHRERLVLKHALKCQGQDVYIGSCTSTDDWDHKVRTAFKERVWVLQEFVPSQRYYYQTGTTGCVPHHVIWGPFVFGDIYGGACARVFPVVGNQGVINSARGAESSMIIEVKE